MERKTFSARGVDLEALEFLRQLREIEQRMVGAILSEAIFEYWRANYEPD